MLLEDAAAGAGAGTQQQQQQGDSRGWTQLPEATPVQAAAPPPRQQEAGPLRRQQQAAGEEQPGRMEAVEAEQALQRGQEVASSSGRPPAGEAPAVGTVYK